MQINTTVTREYYAQERYYISASKVESFLTDQVNDLNGEEEIIRDHGKTKTATDIIEMFENLQKAAVDRENEKPDKDWRYMSDEEWDKFINKILSVAIGGNPLPLGGGRSLVNS